MIAARFAAFGLAVGLAALPTRAVEPRVVGTPLLCFPLDVGGAATLPFGGDGFNITSDDKSAHSTGEVVKQAHAILEKSNDPLVHMETLRRTTIWFMNQESAEAAGKFHATLADATLHAAAAAGEGTARAHLEAMRWFDLGYFQATACQGRVLQLKNDQEWLEKAARLAPDDLALRFGVALAQYFPGAEEDRKAWGSHLLAVLDAKEPSPLVKKNAVTTFGAFLHASDWEKLGAEVRKKLGRA